MENGLLVCGVWRNGLWVVGIENRLLGCEVWNWGKLEDYTTIELDVVNMFEFLVDIICMSPRIYLLEKLPSSF